MADENTDPRNRGPGFVEYGLIVGLIAIIIIAVFVALGPQIQQMFSGESGQPQPQIQPSDTEPMQPTGADTE